MAIRLKLPGSSRIRLGIALTLLAGSFIFGLVKTGPPTINEPDAAIVPVDVRPAFPQPIRGEAVRSKVIELMGMDAIPPKEIPFSKGETTRTEDGLLRTPVTFVNSLGETVPGVLLIPAGATAGSLAGVVCMPGTSGDADRLTQERFHRKDPDKGPLWGWARELSRRGFATLSITLKGTLARRRTLGDWETEAKLLAPYGRPQMGVLAEEALRAARVLGAQEQVDPARVGLTGFSLGSYASWWAMACDPSITTAAILCGGLGSLARDIHEGQPERHSSCHYIPGLLRHFDHPEIVADCIAPRPLMILAPLGDPDMAASGVDQLLDLVSPVYREAGRSHLFQVHRPDDGHVFRVKYFNWMAKWFEEQL
jgi:dienelactone hydrolase